MIEKNRCSVFKNRYFNYVFVILIMTSGIIFSCSKPDDNPELTPAPVPPVSTNPPTTEPTNDTDNIVTINAASVVGTMYNFWSTRSNINQTRFNSYRFRSNIEIIKPYVKTYSFVRMLGGRQKVVNGVSVPDREVNNFFKGVDASGKIITDFSGLITSMRNVINTGFEPRIVLDNVPWDMSGEPVVETYGNSRPPNDYGVWRQYINAFVQTLVDEFGMDRVRTWRFRVATEPNYAPDHWDGTRDEFFKHYDITVDEVLKVIPDAIIGPGNLLTENLAKWRTEIIDHCATGKNFATGAIGTKMDFFALSYYEKIDHNTIKLPEIIAPYRSKLDSYPQFSNIPLDIQEFGILRDENKRRGVSLNDATELGASWYATIADMAYEYRITEIYDWGQETSGDLPSGRRHVTSMFLKMEDGERLQAIKPQSVNNRSEFAGVLPVRKDGKIYLLVYNHNASRTSTASRTLYPQIEGGDVLSSDKWKINEWTVDKTHGIFMHELYKDVREAGVPNKNGRIFGTRPSDYFEDGWENVFSANRTKYNNMSELPQTITDSLITKTNGKIELKVDLAPHSVKLIELTPQ